MRPRWVKSVGLALDRERPVCPSERPRRGTASTAAKGRDLTFGALDRPLVHVPKWPF